MEYLILIVLIGSVLAVSNPPKCPRQCNCDMHGDFRRASCNDLNIVDIDVGVPSDVEVYSLRGNVITEVDNYAFRDLKYTSIVHLDLSNNLIFWIGIHGFAGLEELTILNLGTNRLQSVSPDLFWYNKKLTSLDLSENQFHQLKNEPFLVHSNLKVLNLSNSRISFIPDLTFSELRNLEVLDLSNNLMIGLQVSVFLPLHRLEKLSLKDNPWKCDSDFKKLEKWLTSNDISYQSQCILIDKNKPQMFEKMISAVEVTPEREEVNLNEIWNLDDIDATTVEPTSKNETSNFFNLYEERFPSLLSLVVGFQLGVLFGIFSTYCWLSKICSCKCKLPRTRRQIRRARNVEETDTRTSLLWTTIINANTDTPPFARRQLSDERNGNLYCRSSSWEILPTASIRDSSYRFFDVNLSAERSETPPPPYQQCTGIIV